jgi:LAO/AO transport system kinase
MPDELVDRFRRGERLALSRLLSRAARGEGVADLLARLGPPAKHARVVAVTGGAGVGKSTLVGKLIETIRKDGLTVAVLACDPQSPLSGGALLGDRFRMPSRPDDDGVYIRSLAATSGHGAVADNVGALVRLLEAFGFDVILVETVGAGQGDTAVHDLADAVVLLLQPETGDDIQWEKAGLLEVADAIVIHKADLPGAAAVEGQVKQVLALSGGRQPAVLRVSSRSGEGIESLWQILREMPLRRPNDSPGADLLRLAQEVLAVRFTRAETKGDAELRRLVDDWRSGVIDRERAVEGLLRLLAS